MDIVLTVNPRDVYEAVLKDLAGRLNLLLGGLHGQAAPQLVSMVVEVLSSEPEGISLQGGRLQGELGVVSPQKSIRQIAEGIVGAMGWQVLPLRPAGTTLRGGLEIGFLSSSLAEVLSIESGTFTSEGGHLIPWLRWLLTAGERGVVMGYTFSPEKTEHSRTGLGQMVHTGMAHQWSVPAEFSGEVGDNWLTRALPRLAPPLSSLLFGLIERGLA